MASFSVMGGGSLELQGSNASVLAQSGCRAGDDDILEHAHVASFVPQHLPIGTVAMASIIHQKPSSVSNVVQISPSCNLSFWTGEQEMIPTISENHHLGIIDHAWTTLPKKSIGDGSDNNRQVLLVVTRNKPKNDSNKFLSALRIFVRSNSNSKTKKETEKFLGRKLCWNAIGVVALPYVATSVQAHQDVVVLTYTRGSELYSLRSLLLLCTPRDSQQQKGTTGSNQWPEPRPKVQLARTYPAYVSCLCYPFLALVFGDILGIWRLDEGDVQKQVRSMDSQSVAEINTTVTTQARLREQSVVDCSDNDTFSASLIWQTTLGFGLERVTSIVMSPAGQTVALACWDGSCRVYRRVIQHEGAFLDVWDKMQTCQGESTQSRPSRSPPWETRYAGSSAETTTTTQPAKFPTFVALSTPTLRRGDERAEASEHQLMAVSTPGSTRIRCFHLDSMEQVRDLHGGSQQTNTMGLLSIPGSVEDQVAGHVVWVDGTDKVHHCLWHPP